MILLILHSVGFTFGNPVRLLQLLAPVTITWLLAFFLGFDAGLVAALSLAGAFAMALLYMFIYAGLVLFLSRIYKQSISDFVTAVVYEIEEEGRSAGDALATWDDLTPIEFKAYIQAIKEVRSQ